jgi:hypothetical protein
MSGRTIRIYLVDGSPTGMLTAEIMSSWTGTVIVTPRSQLTDLGRRDEAKRTGLYCLVGSDPEQPGRERVYVGEGDNVWSRLVCHDRDETKDFWTRVVVVISKDDNITKSHGRYLESRVIAMTRQAGRANLDNGTSPEMPSLPEPDVADMENFLEQVQIVFPVLGMSFLQPQPIVDDRSPLTPGRSPRFEMTIVGTRAFAVELSGEFVVLKGSTDRKQGVESWSAYKTLRDELVTEGKLVQSPQTDYYEFADNVAFSSPSAAGSVIAARDTNGRTNWHVDGTGQTYAEWHEARLLDVSTTTAAPAVD